MIDGAASHVPEQLLLAGFRVVVPPAIRVEPCACGGSIGANPADVDDVTEAVRAHNGSARHQAWRVAS
jgi:hypothetical protein